MATDMPTHTHNKPTHTQALICIGMLYAYSITGFWHFCCGPGEVREVQEAGSNNFHLSWYLSDTAMPSYGLKTFIVVKPN